MRALANGIANRGGAFRFGLIKVTGDDMAVLPVAARAAAESLAIYAPPIGPDAATRQRLETLRVAAEARHKLRLAYLDLKNVASTRTVRPLGCFYWGSVWTLAAWCEARGGFRSFRADRITGLPLLDAGFRDEPGKTLADLFRQIETERQDRHKRHAAEASARAGPPDDNDPPSHRLA